MNNLEQVFQLSNKLHSLLDKNKGVVTLHFYDGTKVQANFKNSNTSFEAGKDPVATLVTFTKNLNDTTTHDMFLIKDIS